MTFKVPGYLVKAMDRAAKEKGQTLEQYAEDLGARLTLGGASAFKEKPKAQQ